ncbi:hypothetical protein SAMN05216200_1033 [Oceanicella actignis]|uniref:Uncharacterized protein n=2 Tax=Oceanicella actignis TaxID=1189325 RepID=A0A1M7SN52_9RHOB|nr:hypothetical protein SAMN04488119_1012 [Oceanicella actignis]SHN59873.1 hypothetical protein SAMN05216200_1033 [Oceanicella actignis]
MGASFGELAARYSVSKSAIVKRAKAECWGDGTDVQAEVRRRAVAKVTATFTVDPKKKHEAIEAAAENAADLIARQRKDWEEHRLKYGQLPTDFEIAKQAKISAEMLMIRQKGERLAWGLDDTQQSAEVVIKREW